MVQSSHSVQYFFPSLSLASWLRWWTRTGHGGEFVGVNREDLDQQFLAGKVSAGQFESLGEICLIGVNGIPLRGGRLCLKPLEGVGDLVLGRRPGSIVVTDT
jgi:hypothetical protein